MEIKDTLFIIPARGGSKGLPRKNILPINGKPMIYYSIDAARGVTSDENICVSTDDIEIKKIVEDYKLTVPFLRPESLATDFVGSREVIIHAHQFYKNHLNRSYTKICLLQPTSPLRNFQHIIAAYKLWNDELDMVVSVKESKANPYFNLFEEDSNGLLVKSKKGNFLSRQSTPRVWQFNGAIYLINVVTICKNQISEFNRVKKYIMDDCSSIDIDTLIDMQLAELVIKKSKLL